MVVVEMDIPKKHRKPYDVCTTKKVFKQQQKRLKSDSNPRHSFQFLYLYLQGPKTIVSTRYPLFLLTLSIR